jgi:Zn-finger nucleic acid-binding protein
VESVICPKCQNLMQSVERRGVRLEQCDSCRGIFLDHGELEQIVSAENSYYGQPVGQYQPPPGAPVPPPGYAHGGYRDSPPPYRGGYHDSPPPYRGGYADSPPPYGHGGYRKHRRRGFLGELFD